MVDFLQLTSEGIEKYIKIRNPMLMLDYAEVIPGLSAKGYLEMKGNEAFWRGHYPDYPMMPGTLQLEAISQLFSLTFLTQENQEMIPRLIGFNNVRFYSEVKPGFKLEMSAELISFRHGIAKGKAEAYVQGKHVCSAEIKSVLNKEVLNRFK